MRPVIACALIPNVLSMFQNSLENGTFHSIEKYNKLQDELRNHIRASGIPSTDANYYGQETPNHEVVHEIVKEFQMSHPLFQPTVSITDSYPPDLESPSHSSTSHSYFDHIPDQSSSRYANKYMDHDISTPDPHYSTHNHLMLHHLPVPAFNHTSSMPAVPYRFENALPHSSYFTEHDYRLQADRETHDRFHNGNSYGIHQQAHAHFPFYHPSFGANNVQPSMYSLQQFLKHNHQHGESTGSQETTTIDIGPTSPLHERKSDLNSDHHNPSIDSMQQHPSEVEEGKENTSEDKSSIKRFNNMSRKMIKHAKLLTSKLNKKPSKEDQLEAQ